MLQESTEAVEFCLQNTADVDALDGDGRTPLSVAAMNGNAT